VSTGGVSECLEDTGQLVVVHFGQDR
jgi:hypothetical protein